MVVIVVFAGWFNEEVCLFRLVVLWCGVVLCGIRVGWVLVFAGELVSCGCML